MPRKRPDMREGPSSADRPEEGTAPVDPEILEKHNRHLSREKPNKGRRPWSTKPKKGYAESSRGSQVKVINELVPWRAAVRTRNIKFDDVQKGVFLEHYRENNRFQHAAEAATVCPNTVRSHMEADPEFYAAVIQAQDYYRDKIRRHAVTLALDGVDEPILGGKDRDEIIAYKKVYPIPLIQMELRKVDPGYRDKQEVDMSVRGGVLVVPGPITEEEFMRQYSGDLAAKARDADDSGSS